jgi:hypothetical protein
MHQNLLKKGIRTEHQSIDRDKRAYLAWAAAFQEGRVRLYRQPKLLEEAAQLIELAGKTDRLPNRTKDTMDAAAGAYLNAISPAEAQQLGGTTEPPVLVGVPPHQNASPNDPFGFYSRLPPRPTQTFDC